MQDNAEERSDTKKPRHERRKDKKQQKDQKTQKKPKGSSGFTGGFAAVRQVHAASKEHSNARSELKKAESALAEDKKVLDHRIDVTRSYAQIVSEQTKARTNAEKAKAAAERRIEALKEEHDKLAGELEVMRSEHAEALKPFQNVMESTRGRADDTAKLLSEAKKAAKAAQTEANDAQARLRKLNADFEELKGRPDTDAGAIARMEQEISAEKAHLESTKADIPLVTDEAQKNVDAAQRHLWNQQQALDSAQKAAEEASTEAKRRKAEYDERYQSFQTEEATLDNDVVQREMGIRDASKDRDTAQANIEAAQKLLDEAEDIHAHPEVTKKLAESVAEKQHLVDIQKQEVSSLARSEKQLRSSTRKQRITFISLLIVIAAVILLIIWFLTH